MKRIYLSSPTMHGEEQKYVQEAFDTNWIAPLGPNVDAFERELADYVGCGHAAALSSGTAALHLAMILAGIQKGDTVLCSDLTFAATVNPVAYVGARAVFVDAEADTWNMDPKALERAFEKYPQAKAVVLVHLYGTPAKMDEILKICREHGAVLIEDAAESLGSTYKGIQTGCFGDIGIFSFNGNKIITTSGGGMLVSKDPEKTAHARFLSTQAKEPVRHYEHKEIGYNYRMSNVTAGIGRGQLLHLDEHIEAKRAIYMQYKEAFSDLAEMEMNPYDKESAVPNHWLSCLTLREGSIVTPLDIMLALEKENIESRPIWKPMHLQPIYAGHDFITVKEDGAVSEDIFARGMCLPSDIKNTPEDMEKIFSIIRECFRSKRHV